MHTKKNVIIAYVPFITTMFVEKIIIFFNCSDRHLTLARAKKDAEFLGLQGYTYVADRDMLDNGSKVADRKCYCENADCPPSGTINVAACKYDAPIYFSLPHFYLADESYRKAITGMTPDCTKHRFSLTLEPVSTFCTRLC